MCSISSTPELMKPLISCTRCAWYRELNHFKGCCKYWRCLSWRGLNNFETAVVIKSSIPCWIWMKTMVILVLLNYFNCSCLLCLLQTAEKFYILPISLICNGGWITLIATVHIYIYILNAVFYWTIMWFKCFFFSGTALPVSLFVEFTSCKASLSVELHFL